MTQFGRFELIREIGRGGMATVYEASDEKFGRSVAIRVLPPSYARDDQSRRRFQRELEIISALEHPAIVPIYDFGEIDGKSFLVMRLMAGSLEERLAQGPLSPQEASQVIERIGSALDWIHQKGLVHRNIKPSNILLDQVGTAYLSDFGIVLPAKELTSTGIPGTPAYMSPEEVRAGRVDARTDVYQLGVTLFEMLTGKKPFAGDGSLSVVIKHITEPVPSLLTANPGLSPHYDRVISKAMAKEPDQRYAAAGEMAREFAALLGASAVETMLDPVENPFVVGNPVGGSLFVGRADILTRLRELWGQDPTRSVNSVVLFGHRRMGKTSILQNLHREFRDNTLVVFFTMQRVGRVRNTGELLNYIALALYDALVDSGVKGIAEPGPEDYEPNGYPAFNRFLREIGQLMPSSARNNREPASEKGGILGRWRSLFGGAAAQPRNGTFRRVIFGIDEFELIEEAIAAGRVDPEFLDFLRGVIHSEPWLVLALAGLHTLEEMTADYWNPLFASVTPIRVSFFSRAATGHLLAQPKKAYGLEFTNAAVDRIYELARGQPYLTQLIAHSMVTDYNESPQKRQLGLPPHFKPEDVDLVVDSPEFYDRGSYYFNGVWSQAEKSGPPGQVAILRGLATSDRPLSEPEAIDRSGLDTDTFKAGLKTLRQHDVVEVSAKGVNLTVPLMRRWIEKTQLTD